MKKIIIRTNNGDETELAGENFAKNLVSGDVVAFKGGLGAGKTAFVRGMGKGLKIKDRVTSPTFAIVNEYRGELPLFHFDMYRIDGDDDLYTIDFESYLERDGVVAVEWSENLQDSIPDYAYIITINVTGENTRQIEITKGNDD